MSNTIGVKRQKLGRKLATDAALRAETGEELPDIPSLIVTPVLVTETGSVGLPGTTKGVATATSGGLPDTTIVLQVTDLIMIMTCRVEELLDLQDLLLKLFILLLT